MLSNDSQPTYIPLELVHCVIHMYVYTLFSFSSFLLYVCVLAMLNIYITLHNQFVFELRAIVGAMFENSYYL